MTRPARILLLSADGMLGTAWDRQLQQHGQPCDIANYPQFDITSAASIEQHVRPGCEVVINCCAYTAVDQAEPQLEQAQAINGHGVGLLAQRCRDIHATLIHYSTDYVFNGGSTTPYPVDHPRDPVNAYGHSKALGEQRLQASGCRHLLIRTSWLYAPWGHNFVRTMVRLMGDKPTLRVVNDQRGRPTSAEHLAATSWRLLQHGVTGTFHVTDGGECSWFEFAAAIAEHLGSPCIVEPCTSDEYPTPARRPAYSVLDLTATETLLGPMPPWQEHLASVLDRITGSATSRQ